jgi:hypothetical protein
LSTHYKPRGVLSLAARRSPVAANALLLALVRNVKRLLHPGADTKDIMMQYVSTIRCLRIVDPPGVLLHRVSEPIRRFLK